MTTTLSPHLDSKMAHKDESQDPIVEVDDLSFQGHPSKDSQPPSYGPRKSIGLAASVPLAVVLVWSFGMGSALLVWLLVRRIPPVPGVSTNVFDGFIVVDEGTKIGSTKMLDDQESIESTMRGVLIITAISHFSSIALFPLMSLGAFYVAAQWLDIQASSKDGPTPLQFGLIMQMCSTGTWASIFVTLKCLLRHWRAEFTARTPVSSVVYRALGISSMVVFLHYAVKATDLWLTSEIGSVYYLTSSEVDISTSVVASGLGTRHNTSVTPWEYAMAFQDSGYLQNTGPPSREDEWSEDRSKLLYRGIDTMYGQSIRNHVSVVNIFDFSTPQDTPPMAVIVRPPSRLPAQWSWTASTIGMTTRCQPVPCERERPFQLQGSIIMCPDLTGTYPSMPLPSFSHWPSNKKTRTNVVGYHATTGEIISTGFESRNDFDMVTPERQTNPTYVLIQLHLDGSAVQRRDSEEIGQIINSQDGEIYLFYYGTCEVTMYDVEVAFTGSPSTGNNDRHKDTNSQYRLTSSPVPMSDDRTTLLFGSLIANSDPIFTNYPLYSPLNRTVMNALERSVLTAIVAPGFSKVVSAEFARLCLSLISSMGEPIPAKTVTDNVTKLVSRYPMAGTLSYIAVVYAHGLLALILFVGIIGRTFKSVVVSEPGWQMNWCGVPVKKDQKPVAEVLLVHSRLTDPLALVAEHFLEPGSGDWMGSASLSGTYYTPAGALSTREDPIDSFGIENPETMRVEVGLVDERKGGRRFGLNHRNGRLVQSADNRSGV